MQIPREREFMKAYTDTTTRNYDFAILARFIADDFSFERLVDETLVTLNHFDPQCGGRILRN